MVTQTACAVGVLDDDTEDVLVASGGPQGVDIVDPPEVRNDHGQPEGNGAGPDDPQCLGKDRLVDEQNGTRWRLAHASHESHRLSGGRRLIEQG